MERVQINKGQIVFTFLFDIGRKLNLRGLAGDKDKKKLCDSLLKKKFYVGFEDLDEIYYRRHYQKEHSPLFIVPESGNALEEIPVDLSDPSRRNLRIKLKEKINIKWELRIFPTGVISCRLVLSVCGKTHLGRQLTLTDIGKMMCFLRKKERFGIIPSVSSGNKDVNACRDLHELAKKIVTRTLQIAGYELKPRYEYTGVECPYPLALVPIAKSDYRDAQSFLKAHKLEIANIVSTALCYKGFRLNKNTINHDTDKDQSIDKDQIFLFKYTGGLLMQLEREGKKREAGLLLGWDNILRTIEIALVQGFTLNIYDGLVSDKIDIIMSETPAPRELRGSELASAIKDLNMLKMDYERDKEELSGNIVKLLGSQSHRAMFQEIVTERGMGGIRDAVGEKLESVEKLLSYLEDKRRYEQNVKLNRGMQILSVIFSGAIGLSAAGLMEGATIPGTDIVITGWLSLAIGIALWLLTAWIAVKLARGIMIKTEKPE